MNAEEFQLIQTQLNDGLTKILTEPDLMKAIGENGKYRSARVELTLTGARNADGTENGVRNCRIYCIADNIDAKFYEAASFQGVYEKIFGVDKEQERQTRIRVLEAELLRLNGQPVESAVRG